MDVLQCNRILQVQQKCNKFCLYNTEWCVIISSEEIGEIGVKLDDTG